MTRNRIKLNCVSDSITYCGKRGIAAYHFALGTASVPRAANANATVDSWERLYSANFAGYGFAWMRATRKSPIRAADIPLLAGVMLSSAVSGG